jgi:3-methyladenine DNA glycosylase/8-oxoguanine DNA glycosylase
MPHHPKVIIAMIESHEPVSDAEIALATVWMRDHPEDFSAHRLATIREIAEIVAKGNADLAEMKDQDADIQALLARIDRHLGRR